LQPHNDYFISLLGSIIQQQLSIKAADSIYNRFLELTGKNPTPEIILSLPDIQLRNCGLSNSKVKYVKDLSSKVLGKEISLVNFDEKDDEEIIVELTRVKGIGVWTAHMFLIFTLGRLNVLPTGDLGIKKAIKLNYNLRKMPTDKKVYNIARSNKWEPYCSIASWYLWASLDNQN
jgi:DNA-3-methyladenine glycosylase II